MISAVGWALLAAIEPVGIIAYTIILTRGGRRSGWGFVVGWVLCACLVAVLTVTVAGGVQQHGASVTAASAGWLQVAVGAVALVVLAVRRVRGRRTVPPAPETTGTPDSETAAGPVAAAVVGALVQGWPVIAAAVAAVLGATSSAPAQVLGVAVVVVVSSSTYLTAQILYSRYPAATEARLQSLRRRLEANRESVIDVVLLLAGVWLVLHGVVALLAT